MIYHGMPVGSFKNENVHHTRRTLCLSASMKSFVCKITRCVNEVQGLTESGSDRAGGVTGLEDDFGQGLGGSSGQTGAISGLGGVLLVSANWETDHHVAVADSQPYRPKTQNFT